MSAALLCLNDERERLISGELPKPERFELAGDHLIEVLVHQAEIAGVGALKRLARIRPEQHDLKVFVPAVLSLGCLVGRNGALVLRSERLDRGFASPDVVEHEEVLHIRWAHLLCSSSASSGKYLRVARNSFPSPSRNSCAGVSWRSRIAKNSDVVA